MHAKRNDEAVRLNSDRRRTERRRAQLLVEINERHRPYDEFVYDF